MDKVTEKLIKIEWRYYLKIVSPASLPEDIVFVSGLYDRHNSRKEEIHSTKLYLCLIFTQLAA